MDLNADVKPVTTADYRHYLAETRGFERDYAQELLRSRQWAWRVASCCGVIVLLCFVIVGILEHTLATPLSPLILRVDKATGATDVLSVMNEHREPYGDIIDKYWLNRYVLAAEGYDYHTIQHSYDVVGLLSALPVAKEYQQRFIGRDALDKVLKESGSRVVHVHSIVLDEKTATATAHFSTVTIAPGQLSGIEKNWIATLAYRYSSAPMRETDRLINPLGFQVTSYRVDPEDPSVTDLVPTQQGGAPA